MPEEKRFDEFFNVKSKISRIIKHNLKYSYVSYEPVDPNKTADDIIKFLTRTGFIRTADSIKEKEIINN